MNTFTLPLIKIPYFMGKPDLSFPPEILKIYPFHSSPKVSPSTSYPILRSKNG